MTIDKLVICSLLNIITMVTVAYRDLRLVVVLVPKGASAPWSIGRRDAFFVDERALVILDFAQQLLFARFRPNKCATKRHGDSVADSYVARVPALLRCETNKILRHLFIYLHV